MDWEKYFLSIDEFIEDITAEKMMKNAFKEIIPNRENLFAFLISFIPGVYLAYTIGVSSDTVKLLIPIIGILFNAILPIFGFLFTIYSILLAFMNDSYVKKLAEIRSNDGISSLKSSTTYYESILFLYFIGLGVSGLLLVFLNCISLEFTLTSDHIFNNSLAIILLIFYFWFVFRILYEMKSVIYNTVKIFRNSIAYKLLAIVKDEENKEDKRDCKRHQEKQKLDKLYKRKKEVQRSIQSVRLLSKMECCPRCGKIFIAHQSNLKYCNRCR